MSLTYPKALLAEILGFHKYVTILTVDSVEQPFIVSLEDGKIHWKQGTEDDLLDGLEKATVAVVRTYTGAKRDGVMELQVRGYNIVSGADWNAEKLPSFDMELNCTMDAATGMRSPPRLGEVYP